MWSLVVFTLLALKISCVKNISLTEYLNLDARLSREALKRGQAEVSNTFSDDSDEVDEANTSDENTSDKSPCTVMFFSNDQSGMQTLLRRYRYDANGILIPSSVKYFIKSLQDRGGSNLIQLNDKSFSPYGGYVRYYKTVPPIPQFYNP